MMNEVLARDDELTLADKQAIVDNAVHSANKVVPLKLMPKQAAAHITKATEILYGGAAGGGKSHLIRVSSIMWCMAIPNMHVYIFRRTFKELVNNHINTPGGFPELLKDRIDEKTCKYNKAEFTFEFVNGSMIHLCHAQWESDVYNYLGAQMPMLVIDEATHFTEKMIRLLRSRVRLGSLEIPAEYKGMFPRIIYASNPGGVAHRYFKRGFVDYGTRIHRAPKNDGGMIRQFIPAFLQDNEIMCANDPDYADRLRGIGSSETVEAMLSGNWDLSDSTALPDWRDNCNVIKYCPLPIHWKVKRAYDYGFSAPYAVLWYAKATGEEFVDGFGNVICPPKGSIIICNELYGADEFGEGLKEQVSKTANKIRVISAKMGREVLPGPADNSIFNKEQGPSIKERMDMNWLRSDKTPGSRMRGLAILNDMIAEATHDVPEAPCLYVMSNCVNTIDQLPNLQLDDDGLDVDTEQEDHIYDVVRYIVLSSDSTIRESKVMGF